VVIPPGGKIRREQFIRPQVTKIGYKH
jgi:hypothetical protein